MVKIGNRGFKFSAGEECAEDQNEGEREAEVAEQSAHAVITLRDFANIDGIGIGDFLVGYAGSSNKKINWDRRKRVCFTLSILTLFLNILDKMGLSR